MELNGAQILAQMGGHRSRAAFRPENTSTGLLLAPFEHPMGTTRLHLEALREHFEQFRVQLEAIWVYLGVLWAPLVPY